MRRRVGLLSCLVALAAVVAPSAAQAVLGGENGRIVFVSGRESGDSQARGYLLPVPFSTGGGTLSPPFTPPMVGQIRHPTWSPDRTKVAYALGGEIWISDVTSLPSISNPVQFSPTESPTNLVGDRPAWSPDGTRIAYEYRSSGTSASGDRRIVVQPTTDLTPPVLTSPTGVTPADGFFEGKPAWTPDSQTIYYHRNDPNTSANADIYRIAATGGTEIQSAEDSGISEAQPSISPDGTKMCITLTNGGFNDSATVMVGNATIPTNFIAVGNSAAADYNCTWSPDGTQIAYVTGAFGSGKLVVEKADNTDLSFTVLADDPGSDNFDGNPDWAPDARPVCPDTRVPIQRNASTTFTIDCFDTGPEYERTDVREYADSQPAIGTLTQEFAGDPFTYTPPEGFTGFVTFEVRGIDGFGFGAETGVVTLGVGRVIGTPGNDVLVGTPGPDLIRCGRGNDIVRARGGNDRIFCGGGNDRIFAGAGRDRAFGQNGRDRISGQRGKDLLSGGKGRDRLKGGPGDDRLKGGRGDDRCDGNAGSDSARTCEVLAGIP